MSQILELNYENFDEEVYHSTQPVLVEFWTDSSYGCRELEAVWERLAKDYEGKAKIAQMDAETNWQTAEDLKVKVTPTVLLFQNGKLVDRSEGVKSEDVYRKSLDDALTGSWVI